MPDIKLRDGSGVETTYKDVETISVPLADGSGIYTYGLSDEDLTFTGNISSIDYGGNNIAFSDKYVNRVKLENISSLQEAFKGSPHDLSSIDIYLNTTDPLSPRGASVSYSLDTLTMKGLPRIHGVIADWPFSNSNSPSVDYSEDDILKIFENVSAITNHTGYSTSMSIDFDGLGQYGIPLARSKNLKSISKLARWVEDHWLVVNSTPSIYSYYYRNLYNVREILCPCFHNIYPSLGESSSLYFYVQETRMCSNFRFITDENGSPYKLKIRNKTLDLTSGNFGHGDMSGLYPDSLRVYNQETYNACKNLDDWYSYGTTTQSYTNASGSNVNIVVSLGYSHYNHDSAVNTINSLPDTTDTGTNTIKFKGYQGCFTDGGAIEKLTEEEIAVAVAKGWTVAFTTATS